MGRVKIPLYYCKSRVPLVIFRLKENKPYVGLIDTGSEVTMFDITLKDDGMSVINTDLETSFVGVNGEGDQKNVCQVEDILRFKDSDEQMQNIKTDGVLFDLTGLTEVFQRKFNKDVRISAIFGCDFLKERNAKIDFRSKTLTIDD